jgi:hypothetical protein
MNKLQLVSLISLLLAVSAQAEIDGSAPTQFEYDCHQDPFLLGMKTDLTIVSDETSADGFVATLNRTPVIPNPHTTTLTFPGLTRTFDNADASKTYAGKGFNFTVSEDAQMNPRIGEYYPATIIYTDSQGNIEKQDLFCVESGNLGFPAVTGSN